ncbi:hypothetical protein ACFCXA_24900 [Streptomyces virginiae]|uniref:hypothetical protein n=1 Tax=Streptomyces virginiae TaxID=1961 RepID=UPI0035D59E17
MEAAGAAFEEFLQVPVEGIEEPEDDGDGDRQDPHWQSRYWKVEFRACFAGDPAWAGLHIGGDSGFDHAAIGVPRAEALAATRRLIDQDPLLSAMWRDTPIDIEVTSDQAG